MRRLLAALLAVLFVAGCGGSTDGGGGQLAGIEGTGIVSGFGSVYVDGIEFATNDAQIQFNGAPSSEAALRTGDVVTVAGTLDGQGRARAQRIAFDRLVDGPIQQIETRPDGSGELIALRQRVRFDADTRFITTESATLQAGDLVAISGVVDEAGVLKATSIEHGPAYSQGRTIDIRGQISTVSADRFQIGALPIRYDASMLDDPSRPLSDGDYVQVFGRQYGDDTPLMADRIVRPDRRIGEDGERVFLEGMATDAGNDTIELAGQTVDISNADRVGRAHTAITDEVVVSIRGVRRGEIIVADTLEIEPAPTVRLRARLNTIDDEQDRVTLLGTRWQVQSDTLYLDRSDADDRRLRLARLGAGDTIEAIGYPGVDGLVMTRLDRVDANAVGDASLSGPVDTLNRNGDTSTIELAGAAIVTREDTTEFRNRDGDTITPEAFYAAVVPGTVILATGPENADASRIEIARAVRLLE